MRLQQMHVAFTVVAIVMLQQLSAIETLATPVAILSEKCFVIGKVDASGQTVYPGGRYCVPFS